MAQRTAKQKTSERATELTRAIRLNALQKARVFLSSRMSYKLEGEPLTEIRKELKQLLQTAFPFLSVELAEDWTSGKKGSAKSLSKAGGARSDIFVVILVDSAGYRDESGLFATEGELIKAITDSWDKVLVFVERNLPSRLKRQPADYRDLVQRLMDYEQGKNVAIFGDKQELFQAVFDAVAGHCAAAVRRFPSLVSGKSETQMQWELMTFTERHKVMLEAFREETGRLRDVGAIESLDFDVAREGHAVYRAAVRSGRKKESLPMIVSACPDRFSYAEAARFVGYPFRTMVDDWSDAIGPLHVVLIYRNITDTQIRRHLGNPDIRVAREPWGFFARDPERFIQSLYLVQCQAPIQLHERLREALGWLAGEEWEVVMKRARDRGRILAATRGS